MRKFSSTNKLQASARRAICIGLSRLPLPAMMWLFLIASVQADPPSVSYIFPSGGQQGTTVEFQVGGHYLHEAADFEMRGSGIQAPQRIHQTRTLWFEGPIIPMPDSQRSEDYPRDYAGVVTIAPDAPPGNRYWNVSTSQGITPRRKFVIGDLPETVEEEIDGRPIPVPVELPITINGRIFPREDVDIWTFHAEVGQVVTCEVHAARIGSPLDSRLEVHDPNGRRIAESTGGFGSDSFLRFRAPMEGTYSVHIHDINFGGLQHYVYRLTIVSGPYLDFVYPLGGRRGETVALELTGVGMPEGPVEVTLPDNRHEYVYRPANARAPVEGIVLELSDYPEYVKNESAMQHESGQHVQLPAVMNGRISQPGQVDRWSFPAEKGRNYEFDLRAARLGSPLDSVLSILDAAGNELATSDDLGKGQTDSRLKFQASEDGICIVQVQERFSSRGDRRFAYRLQGTIADDSQGEPNFQLSLSRDTLTLERGGQAKLDVNVQRLNGFQGEIELEIDGLPPGIRAAETTIAQGKSSGQLVLEATEKAAIQVISGGVMGRARVGDPEGEGETREIVQRATLPAEPGEVPEKQFRLAVAMPTPFRFYGTFETKFAPQGSVYLRHYQLDRGGFEGPIQIRLADRQVRHLQGVTGPTIIVPPGATNFDYPVHLPPWLELGRTSRTCLMAVGVIEEPDGRRHKVSFSSNRQDDQIIILPAPGRLTIESARNTVQAQAGGRMIVPIRIKRDRNLRNRVDIELIVPSHIEGVDAPVLSLPATVDLAELPIQFGDQQLGPFNQPVTIRAKTIDERGYSVVAETEIAIVTAD